MSYRCLRAAAEHAGGLLELFESAGTGCYCNYWHFDGDKNAWLEQCYIKPELNRAALLARLAEPELCGVVALDDSDVCCGWLKLMRARAVPRLYEQRVYRNLPCFGGSELERENVFAVGCFYIAEGARGHGLARVLLASAISEAARAGASALEAFPRASPGENAAPLRPDEVWMGPETLFLQAGFEQVSDFRPYPVLRLHLRS